jgi:NTP pyrophosphatase (non-canonical NTP hydrolase)
MNKEILEKIISFRNDRKWMQYHTGKDLAISLSLEVNELLEIYQWSGKDLMCNDKIDKIKEELADVLIYSALIADCYKLDINKIIEDKLIMNNKKYPVDKAKGKSTKHNLL